MPKKTFRVWGDVRVAFIHTVEAETEEEALEVVSDTRILYFDTTNEKGGMDIQGWVELDKDGEEIYEQKEQ